MFRQHHHNSALRLKHRSGGSPRQEPPQAAVALRSASLRLGVRHGICVAKMLDNVGLRYPHRASGAKAPRTLRPLPLLRFAVSATGGAHLCSIQYYLRFWLSSCRTSLAVSALRVCGVAKHSKGSCPVGAAPLLCLGNTAQFRLTASTAPADLRARAAAKRRLRSEAPRCGSVCGTATALPKCSIMSGCGTRIVLREQKPLALCDRCPCFGSLYPPLAALTFAASSIICAFGLADAAPRSPYRRLELCGVA